MLNNAKPFCPHYIPLTNFLLTTTIRLLFIIIITIIIISGCRCHFLCTANVTIHPCIVYNSINVLMSCHTQNATGFYFFFLCIYMVFHASISLSLYMLFWLNTPKHQKKLNINWKFFTNNFCAPIEISFCGIMC